MTPTALLLLSLLALLLAPLVHALASRVRYGLPVLRWAAVVGVTALVVGHVLPECIALVGPAAVGLALTGLFLPFAAERLAHGKARGSAPWVGLAVAGLCVHALMDGAALALVDGHVRDAHGHGERHGLALALAVLAHRVPEAVGLWALLSRPGGILALALLGLGTVLGFFASGALAPALGAAALAMLQAFAAGVLLHVLAHAAMPHTHPHAPGAMPHAHPHAPAVEAGSGKRA
ncbi:MAG: hypothetical protein KF901_18565 [Myxococcales bacterium]|nr:hypothetical protein [Myxococcales bacterium]